MAHAGDDIVRVLLHDTDVEATAYAIGEARASLAGTGGTVVVHSRSGDLMRRADAYGATGPTLQLMTRLKQLFDPASILAPGRFVV
jgi:FAD/FMN-containing dehydrogenase